MLAASINRPEFERAMEVGEDEVMPCASPVGHVAEKRTVRERAMRRALKADARLPFEQLFFADDFAHPLSAAQVGDDALARALEAVRLAPSATNRQPWRVVVAGDVIHFFELHSLGKTEPIDIQKVDMGIALAHFDLAMRELGRELAFAFDDPALATPADCSYVISAKMSQ